MCALMFGILLMQATQLPHNMMEWMNSTFVHCAPNSTPTYFVVNAENSCAKFIDPHTCGDTTAYLAHYMSHVLRKWNSQRWSVGVL